MLLSTLAKDSSSRDITSNLLFMDLLMKSPVGTVLCMFHDLQQTTKQNTPNNRQLSKDLQAIFKCFSLQAFVIWNKMKVVW